MSPKSFYDQVLAGIDGYVAVNDAEEEVCDLYSVYYSCDIASRLDLVDASKTELEVEIEGSGRRALNLTIAQNPHINSELGQTGAVLWNSSVVMSRFFANGGSGHWDMQDLTVVELGSGCGLVGLVLHQLGARRVVLTDQLRMQKLLNRNIEMNRLKPRGKPAIVGELLATEYRWGEGAPEDPRVLSTPVDVIVASDCVYHESVAPLLVQTLVAVCESRRDDGQKTVAVVGQELRSDLVHQVFLTLLIEHFNVYRVPVNPEVDGVYVLYVMWLK
ncbi:hypothetical protein GGI07_003243 [Coemansia sp. Benny D115]|nr:hypothetical protein GGI07_003243 [Coemansia sp. Benny D115]